MVRLLRLRLEHSMRPSLQSTRTLRALTDGNILYKSDLQASLPLITFASVPESLS